MRIITIILAFVLLAGCDFNDYSTNGSMAGPETRVRFEAYEEMCARDPESVLCTEEGDTND